MLATTGGVFLLIHDWLYIKEFLSASLLLPIVMRNFNNRISERILGYEKSRRAKMIIRGANISFYLITLIWFLVSCFTASFTVRMSQSLIMLFMTIVLLWSVCNIKNLIKKKISM